MFVLGVQPGDLVAQIVESASNAGFHPWIGKSLWRREWEPTPAFSPGESQGQRILAGYSPLGRKGSDTTGRLTHTWWFSYIYVSDSLLLQVITKYWVDFPVLYSRTFQAWLTIFNYFIYNSVYLLIPNSQFIPPPPTFPLVTKFVLYVCESAFLWINSFVSVF